MILYFLMAVIVIKKVKNGGRNLRVACAVIEKLREHPRAWFKISLHQRREGKNNADPVLWWIVTNQIGPNLKGFLGAFDG